MQYRINSLPAALSLEVSPLNEGADPEDYELSATTFEIPAEQGATGTAAISLTALQDTRIAEGDEAVELRLVPPAGIRAELDGNLEVTIADAGASPCSGVRVVATPVEPVPNSRDYLRTTLELARDAEAGAVWLDWGGPYYNGEYCDDDDCREWWEKSSPILEVNLVEWRMESSPGGTSDLLDIEWDDSNTLRFGFRSSDGGCEGDPTVACTAAGCEVEPVARSQANRRPPLGAPASPPGGGPSDRHAARRAANRVGPHPRDDAPAGTACLTSAWRRQFRPLRFDFSTKRLQVGRIRPDLRLNMVEDLPMNEPIAKSENHVPTPLAHVPGQPYTQAQDAQERPMTGSETERLAGRGEPLTRTERLLITMFVTMFATMIAAGALAFTTLSGQLLDMQGEIGDLRAEMHEEIGNLSERMARVEERLTRVEEQVARVEERLTRVEEQVARVEERLTGVEERLTGVEGRLTGVESSIRTHHGPPAGP